jgi:hypothetical protein
MVANYFKRIAAHFANEYAVVTPNGLKLSGGLQDGLDRWKKMPEAQRKVLDDLGPYAVSLDPAPPARGLIVKVFARALTHDSEGQLSIYKDPKVPLSMEPGRDHLWLTEAEAKSLLPLQAKKGVVLPVPEPVADRICRRYLVDLVRIGGNGGPRRPEHLLSRELKLTVEEATVDNIRLRLDGTAVCLSFGDNFGVQGKEGRKDAFPLLGYVDYDVNKKAFTRFDIVAVSETGHYDEITKKLLPLGVAFVLTRGDKPADRIAPSSFAQGGYFGKENK